MKNYSTIIIVSVLCLLLTACENTDSKYSSSGSDFTASDYSLYSTVQGNIEGDTMSEVSSAEIPQIESNSEAQTSSVQNVTPQSSSAPAPTQSSVLQSTQSSSKPAAPQCKHNYSLTKCTATCTANGQNIYTCSLCGNSYTEQTAATGHKWNGHKCSVCSAVDENKMKESLYNWFCANSVAEDYGNYYHLPSDSRYKFSAIGGGNFFFYLDDEEKDEYITISVYGFEKNTCYITYILNNMKIEGEFPMDSVHSTDRNFFNAMHAAGNDAAAKRDELVSALRGKIDGFLKKFENEVLIPKTDITLKDLGFTCY